MNPEIPFEKSRRMMVEEQLKSRGIRDERVLKAMGSLPREAFVPEGSRRSAYADSPVSIGCGQTISQPYMAALMTELLELAGNEKVLEIGTGSGYQTALLALLAREVYTVERVPSLLEKAGETLEKLGITRVKYRADDGTLGWKESAPFDRIIVTASSPGMPRPLFEQLGENGILLIPVGSSSIQTLKVIVKKKGLPAENNSIDCVFVPLIGKYGWNE